MCGTFWNGCMFNCFGLREEMVWSRRHNRFLRVCVNKCSLDRTGIKQLSTNTKCSLRVVFYFIVNLLFLASDLCHGVASFAFVQSSSAVDINLLEACDDDDDNEEVVVCFICICKQRLIKRTHVVQHVSDALSVKRFVRRFMTGKSRACDGCSDCKNFAVC